MSKRITSHIRIEPKTKEVIDNLRREISAIERKAIPNQEILRRTFNHPNLSNVLKTDAEAKRRIKSGK